MTRTRTRALPLSLIAGLFLALLSASCKTGEAATRPSEIKLLNVSYDPTRELYEETNRAFAKHWESKTGQKVVFSFR